MCEYEFHLILSIYITFIMKCHQIRFYDFFSYIEYNEFHLKEKKKYAYGGRKEKKDDDDEGN